MADPTSYAAAIEAAARVAEERHAFWHASEDHNVVCDVSACVDIAAAIRALAPERGGGSEPAPPAAPSGYRMVPVEPTEEMREAFNRTYRDWEDNYFQEDAPGLHWRAMLATAPPPPAAPSGWRILERATDLDFKEALTIAWPDGRETVETVSQELADVLCLAPAPPPPVPAQAESGEVVPREWLTAAMKAGAKDVALLQVAETNLATSRDRIRELEGEVARADERAGRAERLLEDLRDKDRKSEQWLRDAKIMRGYGPNTSFDEVWEKTCVAADSAGQAKERADRLTAAAQAARDALRNADEQDWEWLYKRIAGAGHGHFWKAVFNEFRPALATLASVLDGGEG